METNLKKHQNSRNEEDRKIILKEMEESHSYLQNVNEVSIIKVLYHKQAFWNVELKFYSCNLFRLMSTFNDKI